MTLVSGTEAADVFIQVRTGSKRLPGKALLELGDRTCLAHVVSRARRARGIRHVVACTSTLSDDAPLISEADAWGAGSFTGDLDNCLQRFFDCAIHYGSDVVVRICGDSPLVPPSFIEEAVTRLRSTGADYIRTVSVPVGAYVEAFTVGALERALVCAVNPSLSDDLTYFIGRAEINDIRTFEPSDPLLRRPDLILALNRPTDLRVLGELFRACVPAGDLLSLEEAIVYLDDHIDIRAWNTPYVQKATHCDTRLEPGRLVRSALDTGDRLERSS